MMGVQASRSDTTAGARPDGQRQLRLRPTADAATSTGPATTTTPDIPRRPADHAAECPRHPRRQPVRRGNHDLPLYADLAAYGYEPQTLLPDDYIVDGRHPEGTRSAAASRCTRSPARRTSTSSTATPTCRRRTSRRPPPRPTDPPSPTPATPTPPAQPPVAAGTASSPPAPAPTARRCTVTNPNFLDGGGSPFEGQTAPLCDDKLVTVRGQPGGRAELQPVHPGPAAHALLGPDDQRPRPDLRQAQRPATARRRACPTSRWASTTSAAGSSTPSHTDFNGLLRGARAVDRHVQLPGAGRSVPDMYRFVGNDPGSPGTQPRLQPAVPHHRDELPGAGPGLFTVTDTAPTQGGAVDRSRPAPTTPCRSTATSVDVDARAVRGRQARGSRSTWHRQRRRTVTVTRPAASAASAPARAALTRAAERDDRSTVSADPGQLDGPRRSPSWCPTDSTAGGGRSSCASATAPSRSVVAAARITIHVHGARSATTPSSCRSGPGAARSHTIQAGDRRRAARGRDHARLRVRRSWS